MRTVEDARNRWESLFKQHATLEQLKERLEGDNGNNPCEDGLRSVCWKAFLLYRNTDTPTWPTRITDSREGYASLRDYFLKYIEHPNDLPSTADPLAEDEESPWQRLRRDETIRTEIYQDVERCLQENYFFRDPTTKARMLDILFIFAKLNPDLGYRQGMHELLAPILWVVHHDAIEKKSQNSSSLAKESGVMIQVLDSDYIEHDAFSLFCAVMQTAKSFYEHEDNKPQNNAQASVSAIVARSERIHQTVLKGLDPELADHLLAIDILPQIFLTRWIRLLFGREFSFSEVLSLWDLLFAESMRIELIDEVCVTMLLRIRWQLLEADYSTALTLLLRYPSPEPHKPVAFVQDALYLEGNPTYEGAAFLISKYSGKEPNFAKERKVMESSNNRRPGPRRKAHHSRDVSIESTEHGSPGLSPVRLSQKRLDSLFQDVSSGLHRRAEGWNVGKVVRGAMVEARRNIQVGIQSSASSPAFRHTDDFDQPSPSPPQLNLAAPHELKARIAALENRSKALAAMVGEALDELRTQKKPTNEEDKDTVNDSAESAFAKLQSVQTFLEDPTMPLSERSEVTVERKKPARNGPAPTQSLTADTDTSEDSFTRVSTTGRRGAPSSLDALPETRVAEVSNVVKPVPFRPTARAPIAGSSFSWMLGDDGHRSSFVSSASAPPEHSRGGENRGRPGSLFGDGQRDGGKRFTSDEEDGVALNKLRGQSE
ncbi:hypothetical protein AJ80_07061 [Polytolypa hystricis UAMH7299]|uniref:Rab-GAP TBC domain-containing protein n=1 Tax=Polytolypa hystricis (strain UAMH7299) TaxID=1447883 RepID=A0A2B7XS48_POLH7|nr:hypothetical protein AJ80_07061 [Polytolypa hystricis UAMH7299]